MKKSDEIKDLVTALVKVQSEIKNPSKDTTNPFYKSRYADLPAVLDSCRAVLVKHGLCLVQTTEITENGGVVLNTTLAHVSGQWMSGSYPLNPVKNDPQGMGSAMTYARRYSLQAIIGIVAEDDDDAESAMGRSQSGPPKLAPPREQPKPTSPYYNRDGDLMDPSEYVIPMGKKFKGMKIGSIPLKDAEEYKSYFDKIIASGTPLTGAAAETHHYLTEYLKDDVA